MEHLVIRQAIPDDIPALIALDTSIPHGASRATSIKDWVAAGQCFCAETAGSPQGYAVLHRHFFGQPMLELVMVGHDHRRQGIGQALIAHAIRTRPEPVLWASTNQSNLPMQALLAKLGFRRSGMIEGLDEGDPELIYRLGDQGSPRR